MLFWMVRGGWPPFLFNSIFLAGSSYYVPMSHVELDGVPSCLSRPALLHD